jgi:predicted DNA binding CopG/RHH family protein
LKSISIRLPGDMLAELKALANKKDVPYQSLAKVYITRQIALERESLGHSTRKRGDQKKKARKGTS